MLEDGLEDVTSEATDLRRAPRHAVDSETCEQTRNSAIEELERVPAFQASKHDIQESHPEARDFERRRSGTGCAVALPSQRSRSAPETHIASNNNAQNRVPSEL